MDGHSVSTQNHANSKEWNHCSRPMERRIDDTQTNENGYSSWGVKRNTHDRSVNSLNIVEHIFVSS